MRRRPSPTRSARSRWWPATSCRPDAISRTNQVAYDARGLLASATAPLIRMAAYQRNGLGELTAITDLNGRTWSFAYTRMGRVLSVADPLNRPNRFAYDSRGRLNQTTFADGSIRSNSFDAARNLTRRQFSSGPDLQYAFDKLNRLTSAGELVLAMMLRTRTPIPPAPASIRPQTTTRMEISPASLTTTAR